ncbi:transcriptional regulator [Pyrococcus furiosus DSM 3638]|uniref:Transcriptional activator, putative n=3 Tax=Pyrococcus furiosus TaxID=2261 RepID=Q8U189_PYRFU|nr:TenA family protein [Pyrococcus furiosus]AAL81461.1 transcriptional activator, putative [Pyrococcus furiosus DSM 3638]AFN04117.1 transcriptional activator [Pyrococcus furiosus COM1]QEK78972.1 transcriptional regulator [Pyrococcus furiosus DSM 3638]
MFSEELIKENENIWRRFLPHKFLIEMAENTIKKENFEKWLVNDYYFVKNALRFMALLMAKAPDDLLPFFAESIYYISKELEMFEKKAQELGISLNGEIDWRAKSYVNYLLSVASLGSFLEGFTALYCEEKAYYEAWKWVRENLKERSPYQEFINHWSSQEFGEYVKRIEKILNSLAEKHGEFEKERAREVFKEVSKFELIFWDIAYGGEGNV